MSNVLDHSIAQAVVTVCGSLFGETPDIHSIQIQRTRKEFNGDRTVVVFPLAKMARKSPPEAAEMIGQALVAQEDSIVAYEVVKGFLNLTLASGVWGAGVAAALKNEAFGKKPHHSRPRVMVEYSSPNTNKPLHLGHLRNNFLGYAVANVLEANGHEVIKVQII
ncbi:arginine--tRNA ligase, partial [bacterium]|nr:arginine--tRNA ligase [bacterium]